MAPVPADVAADEPSEPETFVADQPDTPRDVVDAEVADVPTTVASPNPTVPPPAAPSPPLVADTGPAQDRGNGPATRVHAQHLTGRSPKLPLTPSQAVRLASDGRDVLTRARPRAS